MRAGLIALMMMIGSQAGADFVKEKNIEFGN